MRSFTIALLALGMTAGAARAQLTIDWATTDGGGGTSRGGPYTLSGTLGQPDAGSLSGGGYTLEGGFWPGFTVPSAGESPALLIQWSGGSLQISWAPETPGFVLEQSDQLPALSWAPAPVGNPLPVPIAGTTRFYRLRHP